MFRLINKTERLDETMPKLISSMIDDRFTFLSNRVEYLNDYFTVYMHWFKDGKQFFCYFIFTSFFCSKWQCLIINLLQGHWLLQYKCTNSSTHAVI